MADVEEFVESAGLYFERLGLSRTASRVMGCLLAETGEATDAPGLCARLGVAKSSMSVALQQLERGGLVERYRPPRARRDHYRLTDDVFGRAFRAKMAEFAAFAALAEQGLAAVGDHPAARARLERMRDMYAFMAREFPRLLDRWDVEQTDAAPSPRDGSGATEARHP
ncbi:GbsR/MarR family transcriptional regulator [Planomonospora parontospora]|uniref:GbsR/MarR family transcriptional regulator n=1 Tax=Planomonospora parontospora TaxID=58119 RepID=UPI0016706190|nr:MarR family transcriptional regulator [Planomonospora parontospora]GGL58744.1 transcriptional regulator [Planomonospora parontospora subsp. antibiotica]GII20175.1 transcriptional regulator [Planomonospora parontospora subsp. antibiotica]